MTVNNELEGMWKETAAVYFKLLFCIHLEGLRNTTIDYSVDS
jgi:hypothetical protein